MVPAFYARNRGTVVLARGIHAAGSEYNARKEEMRKRLAFTAVVFMASLLSPRTAFFIFLFLI
jgi:hypothetical protein